MIRCWPIPPTAWLGPGCRGSLQIPLTVPLLIVACLGTGAWDCVLGFTQMSCRAPRDPPLALEHGTALKSGQCAPLMDDAMGIPLRAQPLASTAKVREPGPCDVPEDCLVDAEVLVGKNITQSGDLLPLDLGFAVPKVRWRMLDCLSR